MTLRKKEGRAVAFIVVRLNSSRLPGKQLRPIGGRPLLSWTIAALKAARRLDAIVIATTDEPVNDPLADLAARENVDIFRYSGDPNHVTTRLARAGEAAGADIAFLVSGDCPLIPPAAVDLLVDALKDHPEWDSALFGADDQGRRPVIEGLGAYRLRAWQLADILSDSPELKEHHFPVIHQEGQQQFVIGQIPPPPEFLGVRHRVSVDTWADLEFMNCVYERLCEKGQVFCLENLLGLLAIEPALAALNTHVHQRRMREKIRRVLAVVDCGPQTGYGHLSRSRELALRMTEDRGWQVLFLLQDRAAAALLDEVGLAVHAALPVSDPVTAFFDAPATFLQDIDAVFIDIAAARIPPAGWRRRMPRRISCLVLDQTQAWTGEADLVVVPGVVCPDPGKAPKPLKAFHCGREFVIVRRDIRRLTTSPQPKDIDILCYFTDRKRRESVGRAAEKRGRSWVAVEGDSKDFPRLLARSRVFVSGFGVSCYEALALASLPVVWPHSPRHQEEAAVFFAGFGLPSLFIDDDKDIPTVLEAALDYKAPLPRIADGTDRIVNIFAELGEGK